MSESTPSASDLTSSARIFCDPIVPPEIPKCVAPLREGERAPFDGQLLSTWKAIEIGQLAQGCDQKVKLEVRTATRTAAITERRLRTEIELANAVNEELSKSDSTSWLWGFVIGTGIGFAGSVTIFLLSSR